MRTRWWYTGAVRRRIVFVGGLCAVMMLMVSADRQENAYRSPQYLVADTEGETLYIADVTAKRITLFDIASGKITRDYALAETPGGLALSPDGTRLYVTSAVPDGRVFEINIQSGDIQRILPAGHTPTAPIISPDGTTLYVCNRYNNDISVIDLGSGREVKRIPVLREPVAVTMTLDGKYLYVANFLPAGPASDDYVAAAISVIATEQNTVIKTIPLANGVNGLRDICISPDGRYIYATHTLAHFHLPTTQLARGWMNTSAVSVIDVAQQALLTTFLLDDVDLGAANPWGIACTSDGKYLCITHSGTHELSIIDREGLHAKFTETGPSRSTSSDLSFLRDIRKRIHLQGTGPRGLAIVGDTAFIAEYFSNSLGIVDIILAPKPHSRTILLGANPPLSPARRGEMYFHDASQCFQQWQSCTSCHPDAGRPDALNWDLLNDGIGNPKNTKNLLFAHRTPPVMSTGIRASAEVAVRAGIRVIQFAVRPEEDAAAIDEYLKSLQPVPSPHLVDGELSAMAMRGKERFHQAGCGRCHAGQYYTNMKKNNVGTGKGREQDWAFDTPSLIEVWRTAPYLHDGSANTIRDIFTTFNRDNRHGVTSVLSEEELQELEEYVLSL